MAICFLTAALFTNSTVIEAAGQEIARQTSYSILTSERAAAGSSLNLLKKLVKVTAPSVAHIEARKPRQSSTKNDSAAKVAMIEEAGSGVVVEYRDRTFVITNYHVIEGADTGNISVAIEEHLYNVVDVRHDRESDISVILLKDKLEAAAEIGDSSEVEVGEFVVAIGSPFGLEHSVSYGIISAMHRHDLELGPQGVRYQDFFQTDASINPGNSGGPLFDLSGRVIGINTAIASNSGGSDGIGFSIPINMAMRIVTDLIDHGYVRRGFLGVSLSSDFDAQRAMQLGLEKAYGAEVSAINADSPAAKAKIQVGDVIMQVGNNKVLNDSHLVTLVSLLPIGSQSRFRSSETVR
ncbi:MAG: trypsin-like peptidase domain-containing protein [Pirellulaceae bacterium]